MCITSNVLIRHFFQKALNIDFHRYLISDSVLQYQIVTVYKICYLICCVLYEYLVMYFIYSVSQLFRSYKILEKRESSIYFP